MAYADTILPQRFSDYHDKIDHIINTDCKIDKHGRSTPPMDRTKAVANYLKDHITNTITSGNVESLHDQILIDLYDAATLDKHYYDKITASVGPVLSEINKSNASSIFSFHQSPCEIELMDIIKQKKVVYIGLDSLTNPNVAQAVGKAFLSELVSTAGNIYKESNANYKLNDAFETMDVSYFRYQDDILIFAKTKRQLNRCKQRLMDVLHERRLNLSRKKTRIGCIGKGFHFLGIHYPGTQTSDNTNMTQANDRSVIHVNNAHYLTSLRGGRQMRLQLIIKRLRWIALSHIQGRCGKHVSKSNRWLLMGCLPKKSDVICISGACGGCERQIVGHTKRCLHGF
jgi:hypothetical protein